MSLGRADYESGGSSPLGERGLRLGGEPSLPMSWRYLPSAGGRRFGTLTGTNAPNWIRSPEKVFRLLQTSVPRANGTFVDAARDMSGLIP